MLRTIRVALLAVLTLASSSIASAYCAFPTTAESRAIEYFDAGTDRFFLSIFDSGGCGGVGETPPPGAVETGLRLSSILQPLACTGGAPQSHCALSQALCEFVAQGQVDPPSRFFTAGAECAALRQPNSGWLFVPTYTDAVTSPPGLSAFAVDPATGQCSSGLVPVYRFYNNKWDAGLANHRYVADEFTRGAMRARPGWIEEGIAFCVLSATKVQIGINSADLAGIPYSYSANEVPCDSLVTSGATSCIGASGMPYPATFRRVLDPGTSAACDALTGTPTLPVSFVAYTQSAATELDAASRSFVQGMQTGPVGFFVSAVDRVSGTPNSLRRTTSWPSGIPAWYPFTENLDVDVDLAIDYTLRVKRARSDGAPGSGSYAQVLVTLTDNSSGLQLELSPGGVGNVALNPLTVRDAATGLVLVFLPLRDDMPIGRSLGLASFTVPQNFDSTAAEGDGGDFSFRVNRAEFAKLLVAARALEPRLSSDPADYRFASLGAKGETAGQADIGFHIDRLHATMLRP